MSVYAATAPERLDELRTVINAQLNDLATNGPARELDVARAGSRVPRSSGSRTPAVGWPALPPMS